MKNTKHLWRVTFDMDYSPGFRGQFEGNQIHFVLDHVYGFEAVTAEFMEWVRACGMQLKAITGIERVGFVGYKQIEPEIMAGGFRVKRSREKDDTP